MTNCPEDEIGLLSSCPNCEKQPVNKPSHRTRAYWTVTALAHTGFFLLTLLFFNIFVNLKNPLKQPVQPSPIDHDKHLIGTFASPMNNHASYKIESHTPDDWNAHLLFGEPSYESDIAWNKLIRPRSFRLHHDEAIRLNLTDSILAQPGEDFATELGIIHNLHCLRRIRQMLYPDYYYPDSPAEELEYNRVHGFHCLESIRSSMLCYPDLNPHPYFWSDNKYHPVTVSAKVTRQCVDWEGLVPLLETRNIDPKKLMHNTGPPT
ncbi:hypothetical protein EYB25_003731 [Talaromyces marneffei]|nr:hypothetical protein EYB25_003731 [Talaromyces marneffei]